ncbi:MAG TPA: bifunctional GNAT family N-acetyltransferase/carbon-nitrogen hydrolase family protein [Cyclobacteriaceae bacterium]|jgi:predicted amidohydrolase/ribosomal protein S18 acetylase RimI-like enzyme
MEITQNTPIDLKVVVRNLKISDYKDLSEAMLLAYKKMGGQPWSKEAMRKLISIFPEGQLCVEVNAKVVGVALSLIVDYDKFGDNHTYYEVTDNYSMETHDPKGDVLYGIDVFVHPEFRGMRLARRLYDARKELCERLNLRSIIAGGRIPNYDKYADQLTPKEYIEKVKMKEIYDPILTFQISNDFHVKKILRNYLPQDNQSQAFATLLEWNNLYYEEKEELLSPKKSTVRIGLVQWQMRTVTGFEELVGMVEFYVDAVSGYQSDFLLFPEFFNAPLMAGYNNLAESEAIRKLAGYTPKMCDTFRELAVSYNTNIIGGSMPLLERGKLYNVAYLFRRDGTWDYQKKLHITPSEVKFWGLTGGNSLKIFDTDSGKIGILICYDVEFPELPRILADQGMQILFVPFLTDTPNGFNRVKSCSKARAIENECYVAMAGCVGNLPRVRNMDIQYAESAVYSPSDFYFPNNSVVAEATPNSEMMVIADVNLDLLNELNKEGSVQTLKDRRLDLYQLKWKGKK